MDGFFGLIVIGLIVWAVWFFRTQSFRTNFTSFGKSQAAYLAELARNFPLEDTSPLTMKPGETFVGEVPGVALVETRTGARVSKRSLGALTFRVAPGVYATGGGGQSVSAPPPEQMTVIDQGQAVFTDKRVVFVGAKHSREWDFSRMLGATPFQSGGVLMAVSNRQKMSGMVPLGPQGLMPWVAFQIAQLVHDKGVDHAREAIEAAAEDASAQVRFVENNRFATKAKLEQFSRELLSKREAAEASTAPTSWLSVRVTSGEKGNPDTIEVVGESFYHESFASLRQLFSTTGGTEHIVEATLRVDPDNPHSASGKAVAVFIRELKVGHVPEDLAPKVFDQLQAQGGSVTLGARLWLDKAGAKGGKSSVTVILDSRLRLQN